MVHPRAAALVLLAAACTAFVAPAPRLQRTRARALRAVADGTTDCLVVGSGISGSSLAHHLTRMGVDDVLLTEARDVVRRRRRRCDRAAAPGLSPPPRSRAHPGRRQRHLPRGGRLHLGGGAQLLPADAHVHAHSVRSLGYRNTHSSLTAPRPRYEVGIADDLVFAPAELPPWVFWEGKLNALPKNLPGDLLTFNLLTWPGKIRAGLGAVGLLLAPPPENKEESIREFVTRHLGAEVFDRIIDPFVSGVYAGDPDKLAMRAALGKVFRLQTLSFFNGAIVPGAYVRFQEIAAEAAANPPAPEWPTYKSGELCSFKKGLQVRARARASPPSFFRAAARSLTPLRPRRRRRPCRTPSPSPSGPSACGRGGS